MSDEIQAGYVDPETRIGAWLRDRLKCKIWCDPLLPATWKFTAPIGHLQRSAGEGDTYLTLDSGIYDLDFYAADPKHARKLAEEARWEIRYNLPQYTWDDGITVNGTSTISPPAWRPDPAVARRGSTYRIILHGVI